MKYSDVNFDAVSKLETKMSLANADKNFGLARIAILYKGLTAFEKAWLELSDYKKESLKLERRYRATQSWATKCLVLMGDDEADASTYCFRPLGNGTVRIWISHQSVSRMVDRDYDPKLDNYEGWYRAENNLPQYDNSEVLSLAEARLKWVELTKEVYYKNEEETIMYATPAWKTYEGVEVE